jgi:YD repeat-containing protein
VRIQLALLILLMFLLLAAVFGGSVASGAWLLLMPALTPSVQHDLPSDYRALHKGRIDMATGLYIRQDEDLVLSGTPPFVLTRTYRSRDPVSRQFGVGATHNGEWYLIGDGQRFQWAELILESSTRIHFDRISKGVSVLNALFEHRSSSTPYYGARLGWEGILWALKLPDGTLALFKGCGPGSKEICSLTWLRDSDGHWTGFSRDSSGTLRQIATRDEKITFEYGKAGPISRAYDSHNRSVSYEYDDGGRLTKVESSDGVIRAYTYGPGGEMLTIREPGWFIENTFEDGRCVRQITHLFDNPAGGERTRTLQVAYTVENDEVVATDVTEYDGSRTHHEFDRYRYHVADVHQDLDGRVTAARFSRDPQTHGVTTVTVSCTGPDGPVTVSMPAGDMNHEAVMQLLARQSCR